MLDFIAVPAPLEVLPFRRRVRDLIEIAEHRWATTAAILWIARYLSLYGIPGRGAAFWSGWYDQHLYLVSALALAHGNLAASAHWYPLGYSLAASLFVAVMPSDPFLLLDWLLFVLTAVGFRRAMRAMGISSGLAMLAFLATTLIQPQLARVWTAPWNSTLNACVMWWLIAETAKLLVSCPLLSGPLTMRVWIKEGTTNACQEAQARRDHRQAA